MNVERRVVAKSERSFVRNALCEGLRPDGRRDVDSRPLLLSFAGNGVAEVQLGRTRVMCAVTCEVVEPFADRAHDGTYAFDVVLSPMASGAFPRDGMTPGESRASAPAACFSLSLTISQRRFLSAALSSERCVSRGRLTPSRCALWRAPKCGP